jgi:hypothetical protein
VGIVRNDIWDLVLAIRNLGRLDDRPDEWGPGFRALSLVTRCMRFNNVRYLRTVKLAQHSIHLSAFFEFEVDTELGSPAGRLTVQANVIEIHNY